MTAPDARRYQPRECADEPGTWAVYDAQANQELLRGSERLVKTYCANNNFAEHYSRRPRRKGKR